MVSAYPITWEIREKTTTKKKIPLLSLCSVRIFTWGTNLSLLAAVPGMVGSQTCVSWLGSSGTNLELWRGILGWGVAEHTANFQTCWLWWSPWVANQGATDAPARVMHPNRQGMGAEQEPRFGQPWLEAEQASVLFVYINKASKIDFPLSLTKCFRCLGQHWQTVPRIEW